MRIIFALIGLIALTSAQTDRRLLADTRSAMVAKRCAWQGEYCNTCRGGKIKYGTGSTFTEWIPVPETGDEAGSIYCDHGSYNEAIDEEYQKLGWEGWLVTKECICERQESASTFGQIPPGDIVYMFKVGAEAPKEKISMWIQNKMKQRLAEARERITARNWEYRKEMAKKAGVWGVGVAAGALVTVIAAPVVTAAVASGSIALAAATIIGVATTSYAVTATAEAGARWALNTEDKDREIFNAQEAFCSIGAKTLTMGLFDGAGLAHGIHGAVQEGMKHMAHGAKDSVTKIGDAVVVWSVDHIASASTEKLSNEGLKLTVGDGNTVTANGQIPQVNFESASLGIVLHIMLSGIRVQVTEEFGNGGNPEITKNLDALRSSAVEVIKQLGPCALNGNANIVKLAVAEETLGNIFMPSWSDDNYKTKFPGQRFNVCEEGAVNRDSICYCMRTGYRGNMVYRGPVLGVDIDFCLYGQVCAPGSGLENAKCRWKDDKASASISRIYSGFNEGLPNCFAQHLDGWRCAVCNDKMGQKCVTEVFVGTCAPINDESGKAWTCLGKDEGMDQTGQRVPGRTGIVLKAKQAIVNPQTGQVFLMKQGTKCAAGVAAAGKGAGRSQVTPPGQRGASNIPGQESVPRPGQAPGAKQPGLGYPKLPTFEKLPRTRPQFKVDPMPPRQQRPDDDLPPLVPITQQRTINQAPPLNFKVDPMPPRSGVVSHGGLTYAGGINSQPGRLGGGLRFDQARDRGVMHSSAGMRVSATEEDIFKPTLSIIIPVVFSLLLLALFVVQRRKTAAQEPLLNTI